MDSDDTEPPRHRGEESSTAGGESVIDMNNAQPSPESTIRHRRGNNHMTDSSANENNSNSHVTGAPPPPANMTEKMKRIDYVLVFPKVNDDDIDETKKNSKKEISRQKKNQMREQFERELVDLEGIEIQTDEIAGTVYRKLHTPFLRLCQEAQKCKLEMPLLGCEIYESEEPGCLTKLEDKYLVTDDEVDFVSAPFILDKLHLYVGNDDPDSFFRPAVRSFLTNHIMINMDIRSEKEEEEDPMAKKGLAYLLHKKVFTDAFVLHDETLNDPALQEDLAEYRAVLGSQFMLNEIQEEFPPKLVLPDTRQELNDTWCRFSIKYQPLWKIRNYFGEKIALYFAWSGTLTSTLFIPTLFGLACFFYGLYLSVKRNQEAKPDVPSNSTFVEEVTQVVNDSISIIREAFDNEITPYFALVICLWGTIFLEMWKRKNATLAYEWDVDQWEDVEPDRPQFYGESQKPDPIIPDEMTWIYPMWKQFVKFLVSFSVLIVMVIAVFICAASVILYRVFITVSYCTQDTSTVVCLIVSTVCSSLLQAVTIMVLGKIYDKLAVILTDWENHRTETRYNDALIIKLFTFQFANSYTSLFYIAFFRSKDTFQDGLFGLGPEYQDNCGSDDNCMAMLSLQVLILMLAKPFPKFLKDIILPFLRRLWRKRKCCRKKQIEAAGELKMDYLERERLKPQLGDFTLVEYTEKVIVYGFLMLFAASFPLAPLIAILINVIDIRVDGKRMLWWYRRPVAHIAQDIGMWYGILQFLNVAGVITNAFLIAFRSSWAVNYDTTTKLWIVIGFEHIVFAVKFIIAAFIPDVPAYVRLAIKREKYQVAKVLTGREKLKPKQAPVYSAKRVVRHEVDIVGVYGKDEPSPTAAPQAAELAEQQNGGVVEAKQ